MKITIYELVGLIKDYKAPKKIKYDGQIWELDCTGDYFIKSDLYIWLFQEYTQQRSLSGFLNDFVEIIEEDKKIEKISWSEKESLAGDFTSNKKQEILARRTEKLKASLNELIDEVNKLKEGK